MAANPAANNNAKPSWMDTLSKAAMMIFIVNMFNGGMFSKNSSSKGSSAAGGDGVIPANGITVEQAQRLSVEKQRQQQEQEAKIKSMFGISVPETYVPPTFPTHDDHGRPLGAQKAVQWQHNVLELRIIISEDQVLDWTKESSEYLFVSVCVYA